jgi:hypothetical protein
MIAQRFTPKSSPARQGHQRAGSLNLYAVYEQAEKMRQLEGFASLRNV